MDAVAAGATGYVLKQIGSDDLVRALEAVGRGEAIDAARWSQEGVPWPQIDDPIVVAYANGMPVPQRQRPS